MKKLLAGLALGLSLLAAGAAVADAKTPVPAEGIVVSTPPQSPPGVHIVAQPGLAGRRVGRHPEAEPGAAHRSAARQLRADLARVIKEGTHNYSQPAGAGGRRADPAQGAIPRPGPRHHGRRGVAAVPQRPADAVSAAG